MRDCIALLSRLVRLPATPEWDSLLVKLAANVRQQGISPIEPCVGPTFATQTKLEAGDSWHGHPAQVIPPVPLQRSPGNKTPLEQIVGAQR